MTTKNKTMSYIRKLEIVIKNEMQKYNKMKIQRFSLNMKYLNKLQNKTNKELNIIKDRIQEREDKLCGVCYDEEATCKLNCVHKLCSHCFPMCNGICPFCRETYKFSYLFKIDKDEEINDLDEDRGIYVSSSFSYIGLMTSIEHQIKRASSQADILNCCGKFNNLVGFYVFYREQTNNKTIFEIHEHAIILSISNVLLHFSSEGSVRQRAIREQIVNIFHILSGILSTYNEE